MWRAASLSSRAIKNVSLVLSLHHESRTRILPELISICHTNQIRPSSSAPSQIDEEVENNPLEGLFEEIERQTKEADELHALTHPTPWFNLLRYPGRAAWRSSNHLFDTKGEDNKSPLSQTQFNLIQKSGKTNKQLRRTYKRIVDTHKALAIKRERERRMAANLTTSRNNPLTGDGGKLEDKKGRNVGSWKERSGIPITCDDPSVSLLLSQSTFKANDNIDLDGGSKKSKNVPQEEINAMYRSKKRSKLISSAATTPGNSTDKPVEYCPEQVLTNLRYRFGPNYSIVRRVLMEVQSLLGGTPEREDEASFRPKRVLDFGCGVGSSSAAALDVFGIPRTAAGDQNGIEWIHSIDASQSMRDATENILKSVLEGAPWGHDDTSHSQEMKEMDDYERILTEIKGGVDERALERQRKRIAKWEQSWEVKNDYRTRLTFGESIVDSSSFYSQLSAQSKEEQMQRPDLPWQKQLNEQRKMTHKSKQPPTSKKGSFDLILCTYTLSELNSVSSTLAAAALLWEKLASGGILVFVEPGTPDGFSTLRSVRSMLLECSPPHEMRHLRYAEAKRILLDKLDSEEDELRQDALRLELQDLEDGVDEWEEECQVVAPCTHNGLCPMSRHQKNHVKKNTRFGKYEMASETEDNIESNHDNLLSSDAAQKAITAGDSNVLASSDAAAQKDIEAGSSSDFDIDDSEAGSQLSEAEEEEKLMQELIEQGYDKDQLEQLMQLMEGLQDDDDDYESDDSDSEFDIDDIEDVEEEQNFFEMNPPTNDTESRPKSTMAETDVFGSAFCSFVHSFPGGTIRKKGEKFSYLVVQKQTPSANLDQSHGKYDALDKVDIVEKLAQSAYHVQGLKRELTQMAKRGRKSELDRDDLNKKSEHAKQLQVMMDEAVKIEDQFLDSSKDMLGMELVHGSERRKGWGRLIRAPIKKKGKYLF